MYWKGHQGLSMHRTSRLLAPGCPKSAGVQSVGLELGRYEVIFLLRLACWTLCE